MSYFIFTDQSGSQATYVGAAGRSLVPTEGDQITLQSTRLDAKALKDNKGPGCLARMYISPVDETAYPNDFQLTSQWTGEDATVSFDQNDSRVYFVKKGASHPHAGIHIGAPPPVTQSQVFLVDRHADGTVSFRIPSVNKYITANANTNQPTAVTLEPFLSDAAKFRLAHDLGTGPVMPSRPYRIRTKFGTFFRATGEDLTQTTNRDIWEEFVFVPAKVKGENGANVYTYYIKTHHNKYVCLTDQGAIEMRDAANIWEEVELVPSTISLGRFKIRSVAFGTLIRANEQDQSFSTVSGQVPDDVRDGFEFFTVTPGNGQPLARGNQPQQAQQAPADDGGCCTIQ